MMWKFSTICGVFLLFGFALSFPASGEDDEIELSTASAAEEISEVEIALANGSSDAESLAKISGNLDFATAALKMDGSLSASISAAILDSVDKQCMLDEYKKLNIVDKIPKAPEIHIGGATTAAATSDDTSKHALQMIIFGAIGFMCSSKRDAILEFSFDLVLAFRPLTSGFINATNLAKYHDMLICANNYAVVNGIVDPAKYEIEYELTELNQVECKQRQIEILEEMETISNSVMSSSANNRNARGDDDEASSNKDDEDCKKTVRDGSLKLTLKYIFVFQVKLSDQEQRELITQFIDDYRTNLEASMSCLAKYA